jgi:hypothetical protein
MMPKSEFQKERELWWKNFGEEHKNKFSLEFIDWLVIIVFLASIIIFFTMFD